MEKVEKIGNTVVKMWLSDIEKSAREQVENLASLPFVYHHIALMPDCHAGMGMPIGGVLPTNDVVIPNAVGWLWNVCCEDQHTRPEDDENHAAQSRDAWHPRAHSAGNGSPQGDAGREISAYGFRY